MSRYFEYGDQVLWNPSNQVADLFLRTAEGFAEGEGLPTGIGPMQAAGHEIEGAISHSSTSVSYRQAGVPSKDMSSSWKCRVGWHSWARRHDTPDPNAQICRRCGKHTHLTGGIAGGLNGPLGPGGG